MSWITIAWSMVASACLTLAVIHLLIWLQQSAQRAHLLFSVAAISVAAIAACELLLMHAQSREQFGRVIWWAHLPVFFLAVSIVGFVRLYFSAGRPWLGYAACGLRLLDLIINFFSMPNANYKQITGPRHLTLGGESISVAQGMENPLVIVSELSSLLLLVFVVDASITLWRRGSRGERRRAVVVGGGMTFTQRREAELEAARQRNDLAHPSRVTLLGGLAGSIAHELNQPLGAIHSNAEAAEIFLKKQPPDLDELEAILSDIRQDGWRAGEVIHRMRSLLKKGEAQLEPVDVNELAESVLKLSCCEAT